MRTLSLTAVFIIKLSEQDQFLLPCVYVGLAHIKGPCGPSVAFCASDVMIHNRLRRGGSEMSMPLINNNIGEYGFTADKKTYAKNTLRQPSLTQRDHTQFFGS
jgi:hypothetical protein